MLPGAVQGEPHQKSVLPEEGRPGLVQTDAVGLDAVADLHPAVLGLLGLQKEAEEVQPRQGRLPALEEEMDAAAVLGGGKGLFDQLPGCLPGHQAHALAAAAAGHVVIKAVAAAQAAQAGCGLDKKCIVLHTKNPSGVGSFLS